MQPGFLNAYLRNIAEQLSFFQRERENEFVDCSYDEFSLLI